MIKYQKEITVWDTDGIFRGRIAEYRDGEMLRHDIYDDIEEFNEALANFEFQFETL